MNFMLTEIQKQNVCLCAPSDIMPADRDVFLELKEMLQQDAESLVQVSSSDVDKNYLVKTKVTALVIFNPYSKDIDVLVAEAETSGILVFLFFNHALSVSFDLQSPDFLPGPASLSLAKGIFTLFDADVDYFHLFNSQVFFAESVTEYIQCANEKDDAAQELKVFSDAIITNNICKAYLIDEGERLSKMPAEIQRVHDSFRKSLSYRIGKLVCPKFL